MKYTHSGFTLIEVVIYSALVSLLLASVVISTYHIIDAGWWIQAKNRELQEIVVLMRQIEAEIGRSDVVIEPAIHATSSLFKAVNVSNETIHMFVEDGVLFLKTISADDEVFIMPLHAQSTHITNIVFDASDKNISVSLATERFTFTKTVWLP